MQFGAPNVSQALRTSRALFPILATVPRGKCESPLSTEE